MIAVPTAPKLTGLYSVPAVEWILATGMSLFAARPLLVGAVGMFAVLCVVYIFSIGIRATTGASITADEPLVL